MAYLKVVVIGLLVTVVFAKGVSTNDIEPPDLGRVDKYTIAV